MKKIEKLEGSYDVPQLKQKLNEIIDYLNTQPQTEEKECECCKWDDMGYTHEPYCPLFKEYKQDTPEQKEEWEEELGKLMSTWGKVLFVNKGRIGAGMQTAMYLKFYHFIKQLLSEREQFAKEELQCVYNHIMGADVDMEEYYKVLGKIENFLGYERLILTVETGKEG